MPGIFASGSVGISGGFFPGGLTNGGVGGGAPTGKYNLLQNGGTADGVTDNAGALATLCATIGAAVGTIYLPAGMYRVRADVTVPANITLEAAAGAVLSMDAGVTLTLNGPVVVSLCKVFAGVGIVVFGQGRLEAFFPQYWGAAGDGVNDDTEAMAACKVSVLASKSATITLPPGTYLLAGLDVSNLCIVGSGRFATFIVGSGDLLTNAQRFRMEHLDISNVGARGNLVSLLGSSATAVQRSAFKDIEFGTAHRHVYCQMIAVDWWFEDCRYTDADIRSRDFDYANAYREIGCYTWFNAEGLRIQRGLNIKLDGVFEYNAGFGINFQVSDTGVGLYDVQIAAYFESNGTTTLNGDVNIETTAAARIRNVKFAGATFAVSQAPVNVRLVAGGGGNIQRLTFANVATDSASLCTAGFAPIVQSVEMIAGALPADVSQLDPSNGTWVPVIGGTTSDGAFTYTLQSGRYVRVGNLVFVTAHLALATQVTAPVGNIVIRGLPFASAAAYYNAASVGEIDGITLSGGYTSLGGEITPAASYIILHQNGSGLNSIGLPAAGLSATGEIVVSAVYSV